MSGIDLFYLSCSEQRHRCNFFVISILELKWVKIQQDELEQLERLRSEDTPRRPVITHTIDQLILNPKSILLTSSHIGSQVKRWKPKKLEKFVKNLNFRILL